MLYYIIQNNGLLSGKEKRCLLNPEITFKISKEDVKSLGFDAEKISDKDLDYMYDQMASGLELSYEMTLEALCKSRKVPRLPKEEKSVKTHKWDQLWSN